MCERCAIGGFDCNTTRPISKQRVAIEPSGVCISANHVARDGRPHPRLFSEDLSLKHSNSHSDPEPPYAHQLQSSDSLAKATLFDPFADLASSSDLSNFFNSLNPALEAVSADVGAAACPTTPVDRQLVSPAQHVSLAHNSNLELRPEDRAVAKRLGESKSSLGRPRGYSDDVLITPVIRSRPD